MWNDSCEIDRNQAGELFIIVQYSFWEKTGESFVKFWYVLGLPEKNTETIMKDLYCQIQEKLSVQFKILGC